MTKYAVAPTGVARPFEDEEMIVSKTDLKGRITYANQIFIRISQYTLPELLGAPHSLIRHPDMPRCVFKLLWDTLEAKKEIFAYVLNLAKSGDHYWVFAHVTPSYDNEGRVVGYHSNRRKPDSHQIEAVKGLYGQLLAEEQRHEDRKVGMARATEMLVGLLRDKNVEYEQFVLSI
jgi:PAS domain S-box-containing protein